MHRSYRIAALSLSLHHFCTEASLVPRLPDRTLRQQGTGRKRDPSGSDVREAFTCAAGGTPKVPDGFLWMTRKLQRSKNANIGDPRREDPLRIRCAHESPKRPHTRASAAERGCRSRPICTAVPASNSEARYIGIGQARAWDGNRTWPKELQAKKNPRRFPAGGSLGGLSDNRDQKLRWARTCSKTVSWSLYS